MRQVYTGEYLESHLLAGSKLEPSFNRFIVFDTEKTDDIESQKIA